MKFPEVRPITKGLKWLNWKKCQYLDILTCISSEMNSRGKLIPYVGPWKKRRKMYGMACKVPKVSKKEYASWPFKLFCMGFPIIQKSLPFHVNRVELKSY